MKSTIKIKHIILPIFLIFFICGLTVGFLYDNKEQLPMAMQVLLGGIVLLYPILNIVTLLSIPTIKIEEDKIISKSVLKTIEIAFQEVESVEEITFKNKLYKIGRFFSIKSSAGETIDIPYDYYHKEQELLELIKSSSYNVS